MWMPTFACPECHAAVTCGEHGCGCDACGAAFLCADGVFRFASPARLAEAARFLAQYQEVRIADGHASLSPGRYRMLPDVPADDPNVTEWRIRRESFESVCRRVPLQDSPSRRVLDVGAGNGWLSNQLAVRGHAVVATDLSDNPRDGLLACRNYVERFPLVQADFDALPFASGQFNVVVMNASLHYSPDPARTLAEAHRMAAPGGTLVVMDSPMFENAQDGEAMVAQLLDQLRSRYGVQRPVRPGVGFLTFTGLQQIAGRLGRCARFFSSRGPVGWRAGRLWARRRIGRPPAAFGVWVAQ